MSVSVLDTVDGVAVIEDRDCSDETGVGDGTLGGRDKLEGVGVRVNERDMGTGIVGVVLKSEIGVMSETPREEPVTVVGLMNEVSNDRSTPSGMAMLGVDGEARKTEESYDRSVSAAHNDSGMDGLDMVGCSTVEGTVSEDGSLGSGVSSLDVVGVTEDSVRLETVEIEPSSGRWREDGMGDGAGIEGVESRARLG